MAIDPEIWERQPGESSKAYERFCAYRDMGTDRSLRKISSQMNISRQILEKLSVTFSWVSRAEAYDLELERQARIANEKAIKKMRENHTKLAIQITAKAAKRLLTIPDDALSAADIARLVDVGVRIERLSRGEFTENQNISGEIIAHHSGNINVKKSPVDLSRLTDEELLEFEELLEKLSPEPDV